jgi:hypothetical protein
MVGRSTSTLDVIIMSPLQSDTRILSVPGVKTPGLVLSSLRDKSDSPFGAYPCGAKSPRFRQNKLHPPLYIDTYVPMSNVEIERIQTGVRLEKRLLKVLKAVAELKDMSLGDLLEGIVLHAFEGKAPFTRDTLREIEQLKAVYGLTLTAEQSHNLKERP